MKVTTVFTLAGMLLAISTLQAKDRDLSGFSRSGNLNLQPKELVMPKKKLPNLKNLISRIQGTKPLVKISTSKGKKRIREIDYYKDGDIVIPFFTSLAYDGKGHNLKGASLTWSYRKKVGKKIGAWTKFGIGQSVRLEIRPDSTPHYNMYYIDIRLTGKDPKNGLISTDTVKIRVQKILQ